MNHKKRRIIFLLLVLALFIGLPSLLIYREVRHQRLNAELIAAIKARNTSEALLLLQAGADGAARDLGAPPPLPELLAHLWGRLFHRPSTPSSQQQNHPSALLLYYAEKYPEFPDEDTQIPTLADEKLAIALLDADAPLVDVDSNGRSILWFATAYHHDKVLRRLLESHVSASTADKHNTTPLVVADAEGTRLLLEHGAKVDAAALFGANAAKTDILLRHGAEADASNGNETPLFTADDATADLLLQYGAKIEAVDNQGDTPLMTQCSRYRGDTGSGIYKVPTTLADLVKSNREDTGSGVSALVRHGANVNARNQYKATPLLTALDSRNKIAAQILLQHGADIRARDHYGNTALMLAVADPDKDWFRRFLHVGIDINARGVDGNTALSIAEWCQQDSNLKPSERAAFAAKVRLLRSLGAKEVKTGEHWINEVGD